jgi:hypothetical protein
MTEKRRSGHRQSEPSTETDSERKTCSPEEARVWAALEQARQNVKPIVKKERQAEVVTAELLNLRLKAI